MKVNEELNKNKSNYWALTPISFLLRTANIWPEKTAWIHGSKKNNYKPVSYTHLTLPTIYSV